MSDLAERLAREAMARLAWQFVPYFLPYNIDTLEQMNREVVRECARIAGELDDPLLGNATAREIRRALLAQIGE